MAQLGKYQLVAEIARGGMGIVYVVIEPLPARPSAGPVRLLVLKQLKVEIAQTPALLEVFLEEARRSARLHHPSIVRTWEVGSDDGRHFAVMDYIEGVPLARILRRRQPSFTRAHHLRVLREALAGLAYAHGLSDDEDAERGPGVVHYDATPSNVFVTYDGHVKLVDFGIARAVESTVDPRTGVLQGKPSYMAPEQLSGDVDRRVDVFAAGMMLWEAVAGRRVWQGKSDIEIFTSITKGEIPSIAEAAPDAPPSLVRMIDRAVARDRDERHDSAADLLRELDAYLVESGNEVAMTDVANIVGRVFEADRSSVKATIDGQLDRMRVGKPAKVPSLRPAPAAAPSLTDDASPTRSWAAVETPSTRSPPTSHRARHAPTSRPSPAARTKGNGTSVGMGIVALLALAAIAGAFIVLSKPQPPSASEASSASSTETPSVASPTVATEIPSSAVPSAQPSAAPPPEAVPHEE